MNITLATVTALLLLLPGVGFVIGVNIADKNVREIVFRNTPAEVSYVIVVSLVVHFVFALIPWSFNVAGIVLRYASLTHDSQNLTHDLQKIDFNAARCLFLFATGYFLLTAVVGFVPGYWLGVQVRKRRLEFFAKHRWMLDLVGVRKGDVVYARALLTSQFDDAVGPCAIVLEGILYDSFFQADGTLLYLAFSNFKEARHALDSPPYIGGQLEVWPASTPRFEHDRLLVEGRSISMVRYRRFPGEAISQQSAVDRIRETLRADRAAPPPPP